MGWDEINLVIIQLLSRLINSVCSGILTLPSQLALFDNIVTSVRQHFVIDRAHYSDQDLTALAIVDMFMFRLDELTVALHKRYSSDSEISSDSTARAAHRHTAAAASISPAHRHTRRQHSDSKARAASTSPAHRRQHSDSSSGKFPVHPAYELRGRRLMPTSKSPAHCHTRRQQSDSSSIGEFPVHPADELRGDRLPRVGVSLYHGN